LVAAPHRTIDAKQGQARQCKVADNVKNLVAHTFVAVTQPFGIEQPLFVKHRRVLERRTKREASVPEPRNIADAAKGTGAANLAAESLGTEIEHIILAADRRIGKVDFNFGTEAGRIRPQLAELIAHRNLHGLQHLNEAALSRLF